MAVLKEQEGDGFWAAIEKSSNEFIGWFQLSPALDSPFNVTSGLFDNQDIELG